MSESLHQDLERLLTKEIPWVYRLASADRLSGGANQETYRLTVETGRGQQRLALRRTAGGLWERSGGSRAGPSAVTEARLMQTAREAGVPEPEIYYVLRQEDGLGSGFVMEWLDGETLGSRIAWSEDLAGIRPRLATQAGAILARIHGIDVDAAGLRPLLDVQAPEDAVRQLWDRYHSYQTPQPMIDFTARWLLDHLPEPCSPRLLHGDFRNGNLMVSHENGIIAVLDWEASGLGNPLRDLGWLCTNSWRFGRTELPVGGFGTIDELAAGYESVAGRPVDRDELHFWIVFGSYSWAIGCLSMAQHYRDGPDPTVERPAIGRRSSECQIDCVNLIIPGPVELLTAGDADRSTLDMPRLGELLASVQDFLRKDVVPNTEGRLSFLARVAGNSVGIACRQQQLGPVLRAWESQVLTTLLGQSGDLEELRWTLVTRLRDGSMSLDQPGLAEYLRDLVANQVAIDQPRYSGLRTALNGA